MAIGGFASIAVVSDAKLGDPTPDLTFSYTPLSRYGRCCSADAVEPYVPPRKSISSRDSHNASSNLSSDVPQV